MTLEANTTLWLLPSDPRYGMIPIPVRIVSIKSKVAQLDRDGYELDRYSMEVSAAPFGVIGRCYSTLKEAQEAGWKRDVWRRLRSELINAWNPPSDVDTDQLIWAGHLIGVNSFRDVVGFQIVNLEGKVIHGTDEDPFQLASNDVLIGSALDTAKEWIANKDYTLHAYFDRDLKAYRVVRELSLPDPIPAP